MSVFLGQEMNMRQSGGKTNNKKTLVIEYEFSISPDLVVMCKFFKNLAKPFGSYHTYFYVLPFCIACCSLKGIKDRNLHVFLQTSIQIHVFYCI